LTCRGKIKHSYSVGESVTWYHFFGGVSRFEKDLFLDLAI
jgi:hypothetical protein